MRLQDSPFRPSWWGSDLAAAGIGARPSVGTYGKYEFAALPPLPFAMTGDLDWLARQPVAEEWGIGSDEIPAEFAVLAEACRKQGIPLPEAFTRFMTSTDLQRRIRSNTACYLYLDSAPVAAPGGGHLVRFLADQQGCLFWYLYFNDAADDHAVVCTSEFFDTEYVPDPEDVDEDEPDEITYCAESFEAFLCRYWLENEIWFATNDDTPLPDVAGEYIERYREAWPIEHSR